MSNGQLVTRFFETRESRRTQHMDNSRKDIQERILYCESTDEDQVVTDLKVWAPRCINFQGKNLWATEYTVRPIDGHVKFFARVVYKQTEFQPRRQYDVNTANVRIYQSFETSKYPNDACDYEGLIQVDGNDNRVKGVDVYDATLRYQEIWRLPQYPYLRTQQLYLWLAFVGSTNADAFRGWLPEEVLFLGYTVVPVPDNELWYDFTFEYAISPEQVVNVPFEFFDENQNPQSEFTKKGWRYIWYSLYPEEKGACNAIIQKTKAAYQEKIYESYQWAPFFPEEPCEWEMEVQPDLLCPDEERNPFCPPLQQNGQQQSQSRIAEWLALPHRMRNRINFANARMKQIQAEREKLFASLRLS